MAILWEDDFAGTPTSGTPSIVDHPQFEAITGSISYTAATVSGHRAVSAGFLVGGMDVDISAIPVGRIRFYAQWSGAGPYGHHFMATLFNASNVILADMQIRNVAGPPVWNRWNFVNAGATTAWAASTPWRFEYSWDGTGTLMEVWTNPDSSGSPDWSVFAAGVNSTKDKLGIGNTNGSSGRTLLIGCLAMSDGSPIGPYVSGVSAAGAATDALDTAAGSATATPPAVTAAGSATDGRDTGSAAGATWPAATAGPSDARDTAAGAGTATAPLAVTGSATIPDVRDTAAGAAIARPVGTVAAVDTRDTATGAGTRTLPPVTATSATTDTRDTAAGAATVVNPTLAVRGRIVSGALVTGYRVRGVMASGAITAARLRYEYDADPAPLAASGAPIDARDVASGSATTVVPTFEGTASLVDGRDALEGNATAAAGSSTGSGAPTDQRDVVNASPAIFPAATLAAPDSRDALAGIGAVSGVSSGIFGRKDTRDRMTAVGVSLTSGGQPVPPPQPSVKALLFEFTTRATQFVNLNPTMQAQLVDERDKQLEDFLAELAARIAALEA